jgi:hypothetical protein
MVMILQSGSVVNLRPDSCTGNLEDGSLVLSGVIEQMRGMETVGGALVPRELVAPVPFTIRLDGYRLAELARRAARAAGRQAKAGPVRVKLSVPAHWKLP